MDAERLVFIIAANSTRDLEAEDALTRALARNGGDGLTACHEDAGACPKPCLRHRRVNVGIWPNWRCVHVEWPIKGGRLCRDQEFTNRYPFNTCGIYQDHIDREELKRKTAAYIQNRLNQEWDYEPYATPPIFWSNGAEMTCPRFTVSSGIPRPFEGKTYLFDLSDPPPAESPQPSASPPPSLDASLPPPSQDSEV